MLTGWFNFLLLIDRCPRDAMVTTINISSNSFKRGALLTYICFRGPRASCYFDTTLGLGNTYETTWRGKVDMLQACLVLKICTCKNHFHFISCHLNARTCYYPVFVAFQCIPIISYYQYATQNLWWERGVSLLIQIFISSIQNWIPCLLIAK